MGTDSSKHKSIYLAVLALIFLFSFVLNYLTPLSADDYDYLYCLSTGDLTKSVFEIFPSMAVHYNTHGGRIVAHFFAQLFLFLGKPVFNVVNALMYTAFIVLLCRHMELGQKRRLWLLPTVFAAVWFLLPNYGQTVLFLTGACNYLWAVTVVLAFLLPYRAYFENPKAAKHPLLSAAGMLLFGLLAGFQSETASGAAVFFVLLGLMFLLIKRERRPLWFYAGLLGSVLSLIVMVIAPGNFVRLNDVSNAMAGGLFGHITSLFLVYTAKYLIYVLILGIGILPLLLFGRIRSFPQKTVLMTGILILVSLASSYVMLLSLTYPPRAQFTYVALLIAAAGYFFLHLDCEWTVPLAGKALTALLLVGFFAHALLTVNDLGAIYVECRAREASILDQKAAGIEDVTVAPIDPRTVFSPLYAIDLGEDPAGYVNRNMERYYGIPSIRTVENDS